MPAKPLPYVYDDGGREEAGIDEHNDCVVRTLAILTDRPYLRAHQILRTLGRRDRGRTKPAIYMPLLVECGAAHIINKESDKYRRISLGAFVKEADPKGRYAVRISGHMFAVVDGVIRDTWQPGPRSIVKDVFEFPRKNLRN